MGVLQDALPPEQPPDGAQRAGDRTVGLAPVPTAVHRAAGSRMVPSQTPGSALTLVPHLQPLLPIFALRGGREKKLVFGSRFGNPVHKSGSTWSSTRAFKAVRKTVAAACWIQHRGDGPASRLPGLAQTGHVVVHWKPRRREPIAPKLFCSFLTRAFSTRWACADRGYGSADFTPGGRGIFP